MLSTPTNEALIAAEQITRLPRWADFEKMFEAEIKAVTDRMLGSRDAAELHELRGRALALTQFRQAMRDARQTLGKKGVTAPLS